MLSARDSPVDVAKGLRYGADDYVRKPFSLEEILLRITAILRRSNVESTDDLVLSSGPIEMNVDTHEITVDAEPVTLSATEFRLLEVLLERKDASSRESCCCARSGTSTLTPRPRCSTPTSRTCVERSPRRLRPDHDREGSRVQARYVDPGKVKIATRLTILLVVLTVMVALTVGWFAVDASTRSLYSTLDDQINAVIHSGAGHPDAALSDALNVVQVNQYNLTLDVVDPSDAVVQVNSPAYVALKKKPTLANVRATSIKSACRRICRLSTPFDLRRRR